MRCVTGSSIAAFAVGLGLLRAAAAPAAEPGQDLKLSYRSEIDDTDQPYRLYVPSGYDGGRAVPLVIALHGSSGNQSSLFDDPRYGSGAIKRVAERHGVLVATPHGRGLTEYRGVGENDVLRVLAEVRARYRVDPDRIYILGHSMGGTGSAYLALHHPDLFAAAAPLAAADSFAWLAANAGHVPFWWIGGADDREFFLRGVAVGFERMRRLGCPARMEILPGEGHWGPVKDFERIVSWLLEHRRNAHPRAYVFEVDTPLHGRAYWSAVEAIAAPGTMARVTARAEGSSRVLFDLENVARFVFLPDEAVSDLSRPLEVLVSGKRVFSGPVSGDQELVVSGGPSVWEARTRPRRPASLTAFREHPVAVAPESLDMLGTEARLANWIADAIRAATGADLALVNRQHYRGLPIPAGTVDVVDLVQCSKPFDQYLVTVRLTGREILEILDDNVPDPAKDRPTPQWDRPGATRLVQAAGARYRFDRTRPPGRRIVWSDLDPERRYRVALEGQVVERETILLAGRFKKLAYEVTEIPFSLALYGHAARLGRIEARVEGRVQEQR